MKQITISKLDWQDFIRLVRDRIDELQDKDQVPNAETWRPLLNRLLKKGETR